LGTFQNAANSHAMRQSSVQGNVTENTLNLQFRVPKGYILCILT